ncbi:hypothetical protein M0R45_029881 [Rubus argutus]|uniref:Uncharacterized protein n=1 Tax=Rubus argutus TaxID=59490 RepID=A0AAW1WBI5_RUBAR
MQRQSSQSQSSSIDHSLQCPNDLDTHKHRCAPPYTHNQPLQCLHDFNSQASLQRPQIDFLSLSDTPPITVASPPIHLQSIHKTHNSCNSEHHRLVDGCPRLGSRCSGDLKGAQRKRLYLF